MENRIEVIYGAEEPAFYADYKIKALINFYSAFNKQDQKAMARIWSNSIQSTMNNPNGAVVNCF